MKKRLSVVAMTLALLAHPSAYSQEPTPSPEETPTPPRTVMGGCNHSGWNTEVYRFYGAKETLIEKVTQLPREILKRRVFLQVTQGDSVAEIKLFERQPNGTFNVTEWTKKDSADLFTDIDRAIMANKAVDCVGEQVTGVLIKDLKKGRTTEGVSAPESPKSAFSHSIRQISGEFIQTTIIVMC